jgi:hypothetical protein
MHISLLSGARMNFCVTGYQHSAPPALGRNSPAVSSSVPGFDHGLLVKPRTLEAYGPRRFVRISTLTEI